MNEHVSEQFRMTVSLKDRFTIHLKDLESIYGESDFRTGLLGLPMNSLLIHILNFKSNETTFYSHDWWDSIGVPEIGRKGLAERIETFSRYFGFVQFVSHTESQLRTLIRKLSPGVCNSGRANFESIYKHILKKLRLDSYQDTFYFMRLLRNSMHNNGVFLPENSMVDKEIHFKGKGYVFSYGQPIDFFTPELVPEIQEQVLTCLFEIAKHNCVKKLA